MRQWCSGCKRELLGPLFGGAEWAIGWTILRQTCVVRFFAAIDYRVADGWIDRWYGRDFVLVLSIRRERLRERKKRPRVRRSERIVAWPFFGTALGKMAAQPRSQSQEILNAEIAENRKASPPGYSSVTTNMLVVTTEQKNWPQEAQRSTAATKLRRNGHKKLITALLAAAHANTEQLAKLAA